ncbi:MAG TPA: radical SAM protein [Planctomycetota bacterium]|jgi:radical SAM protein with 4Fe4S-binding SPASM domain
MNPQAVEPPLFLVFWELTARCNLTCRHCRRLDVDNAADLFSTADALNVVDQVADCGNPILVLSGGEPLMRKDVFEIARHGVQRGLIVSLATNGTLVDDAMADKIAAAGIRRVSISIDGVDAKTHDEFRGLPGSLEMALNGFRRLKARGVSMQINCTMTNRNIAQREAFYDLATREGADALHFFVLVPVGCGLEIAESHRLNADQVEDFLQWLADRSVDSSMHVKATCAPQYFRILNQKGLMKGRGKPPMHHQAPAHHAQAGHPGGHPGGHPQGAGGIDPAVMARMQAMTRGCLAGTGVCFISNRGEVFPCGYLPLIAGNVKETPLREIWTSSKVFGQFRDPELLEGKCGDCGFRVVCAGCRARALGVYGNSLAEDPYCSYKPPPRPSKAGLS